MLDFTGGITEIIDLKESFNEEKLSNILEVFWSMETIMGVTIFVSRCYSLPPFNLFLPLFIECSYVHLAMMMSEIFPSLSLTYSQVSNSCEKTLTA